MSVKDPRGTVFHPILNVPDLAEDDVEDPELEKRIRSVFEDPTLHAKYRIQVMFNEERSEYKAYRGFIVMWFHNNNDYGDGDRSLYLCPKKVEVKGALKPCSAPIPPALISNPKGLAVCPRCKQASDPRELTGQIFARLPTQRWAKLVTRVFGLLECAADIEIDYIQSDIRAATAEQHDRFHRDALKIARSNRKQVTYLLRRLVQDTSNGTLVEQAIYNFLKA